MSNSSYNPRRSRGRNNGQLDHLEHEVSEVTSLLKDNVEKVMDRGERIDSLQARSEDLESSSSHFKRSAVKVRRKMCMKNGKMTCIIVLVVFVIIAVVTTILLLKYKPWESSSSGSHHHSTTTVPSTTKTNGYLHQQGLMGTLTNGD